MGESRLGGGESRKLRDNIANTSERMTGRVERGARAREASIRGMAFGVEWFLGLCTLCGDRSRLLRDVVSDESGR